MTPLQRQNRRAKRQRRLARDLMGRQCRCGSKQQLEFHHVDRTSKVFNVGQYFGRVRWQRIEQELVKCEVVCRPCHERTFGDQL